MKTWAVFLLFLGVSFALYANSFGNGFVFDDNSTFRKPRLREQSISELLDDYRPLRYISYRIDEAVLGSDEPWVYHVFNTLYHALASFVVFLLLRRLGGEHVALAGALLFAAHPVQTESVAYLSGRRDVLSTLFYLLAFLAWMATRTSWFTVSLKPGARWLLPVLGLFALAFFTKEMAATLPLACLLFDAVVLPARARRRLRALVLWPRLLLARRRILPALYAAGALAGVAGVIYALKGGATTQGWHGGSAVSNYATSAGLVSHYALLLLFPLRLLGDRSFDAYPLSHSFLEVKVLLSLAALAVGILVAIRVRRRAPLVTFGLAWFLVTLLPVLHIRPFHEIAADHYLYLPSVGFCLLLGLGFAWLRARFPRYVAWTALCLLLAAYSTRTVIRNRDWKDTETFWKATLITAPRCARASFNLGSIYAQRAKAATNASEKQSLYSTAAFYMARAVNIRPSYATARIDLGRVYRELGNKQAAREQWQEALRLLEAMDVPPSDPGLVCIFLEDFDRALKTYEGMLARRFRATTALRGIITCRRYLASKAMVAGRPDEARPHFREALKAAEMLLVRTPHDRNLLRGTAELARECGDTRREAELRARLDRLGTR